MLKTELNRLRRMIKITAAKFKYDYKDEILKSNMVHGLSRAKRGIRK
jgi:hypothetical protein